MPAENVELVRRWFEGFGRGELTLEICDPEIEIRNWAEFPITGPYLGHEGVRRWWDDIADAFEDLRYELLELIDVGDDRVVMIGRMEGSGGSSGASVDTDWGVLFVMSAGRAIREQAFFNRNEALEAVGLRE
jgi:ketosteroid isomerase-like protein